MIKKLLLFIFTLFINPTCCQQQETVTKGQYQLPMQRADMTATDNTAEPIVIENTGFYWVIVKHMPSCWTFWKRWRPVRIMAAYAKTSTREVWHNIDSEMPILMTTNLEDAQNLQAALLPLGCDIEIHEVAFSFDSNEDAEYFKKRQAEKYAQ